MDTYTTITAPAEGLYTEKRSRFIASALPVRTEDEVRTLLDQWRKKYFDARHVCYAYMLGADRTHFRSSDNGEPSGTAGKPILGQINSAGLTDVLVIVVRYFGGVKLGTPGLIRAYRAAAAEALAAAGKEERTVDETLDFTFPYPMMNAVMRAVRDCGAGIDSQDYVGADCRLTLRQRKSLMPRLREALDKLRQGR